MVGCTAGNSCRRCVMRRNKPEGARFDAVQQNPVPAGCWIFFVHEPRRVSPKKKIRFRSGTRTEGGCRRLNVSFRLRFFSSIDCRIHGLLSPGFCEGGPTIEGCGFFPVMCGFSGGARRDVDDMPGKRGYSQLCLPTGFIPNLHEQKLSE